MSEGCRGCTGRCCYDVVVHVTPFDVRRIAVAQHLEPIAIVRPREVTDRDRAANEAFGVRLDGTPRRFRPVLRKSASDTRACQFLIHIDDERKRCGIYADRPRVCAVYPFSTRRGSVDLRDDARCAPGDWDMARLDYAAVRREIAMYSAEWAATARIEEAWNAAVEQGRRSPSFASFARFADRVAGELLPYAAATAFLLERWNEALLPPELAEQRRSWLDGISVAAGQIAHKA